MGFLRMIEFDYERLAADFKDRLVTQLRSHGAGNEYLETWVPDDDPVKSIVNMVEAVFSSGGGDVTIRLARSTLDANQRRSLLAILDEFGTPRLETTASGYVLALCTRRTGPALIPPA